jgi:hypothetical protein
MALPSNIFRTQVGIILTGITTIYTAPVGYTGVVLLAQVSNISPDSYSVTFSHQRSVSGIAVTTEILKNYPLSGYDTLSMLSGKLALESGDSILISGNTDDQMKYIVSILETLNN